MLNSRFLNLYLLIQPPEYLCELLDPYSSVAHWGPICLTFFHSNIPLKTRGDQALVPVAPKLSLPTTTIRSCELFWERAKDGLFHTNTCISPFFMILFCICMPLLSTLMNFICKKHYTNYFYFYFQYFCKYSSQGTLILLCYRCLYRGVTNIYIMFMNLINGTFIVHFFSFLSTCLNSNSINFSDKLHTIQKCLNFKDWIRMISLTWTKQISSSLSCECREGKRL